MELIDKQGTWSPRHLEDAFRSKLRPRSKAEPAAWPHGDSDKLFVVTSIGAQRSGASSLLNRLFGTSFATRQAQNPSVQVTKGVCADIVDNGNGDLVSIITGKGARKLVVLDTEGFDQMDEYETLRQDFAGCFGVLASDMVLINVFMNNIANRVESSGVSMLRSVAESLGDMKKSGLVMDRRIKVVFVIRDYDVDEIEEDEVMDILVSQINFELKKSAVLMTAAVATAESGQAELVPPSANQFFDIQFEFVPNQFLNAKGYEQSLSRVAIRVNDTLAEVEAAHVVSSLVPDLQKKFYKLRDLRQLAKALADPGHAEAIGKSVEIEASYHCEAMIADVYRSYLSKVEDWKMQADSGRMIRSFGHECTEKIEETLKEFLQLCSVYKDTNAFKEKSKELLANMLLDLQALYGKQVLKVRDVAYHVFKEKVTRIQLNPRVEKEVDKAIAEADKFFVEKAIGLRCSYAKSGSWRYENERQELLHAMRENATERLQLARLQGSFVPQLRKPVQVSLHWLNPAPFGFFDSRFPPPLNLSQPPPDPDRYRRGMEGRITPIPIGKRIHVPNLDYEAALKIFEQEYEGPGIDPDDLE